MKPDKVFDVIPMGAPRMTQRDRWGGKRQRPCVSKYFSYRDQVRWQVKDWIFPEHGCHVVFHLPLPKKPRKSKGQVVGYPHKQTPDIDNLLKALLDALFLEDSGVFDIRGTKLWGEAGKICCYEFAGEVS